MSMTADELIAEAKIGTSVPTNQVRLSESDMLTMAYQEIVKRFVPKITSLRQEFFIKSESITLVASQVRYAIPYRAIGRTLRSLWLVQGTDRRKLAYVQPHELHRYPTTSSDSPWGFYFEGDEIVLLGTPSSSSGTLEVPYPFRPSRLAVEADCGQITAINTGTGVITIDTAMTLTTSTPVDFIKGKQGNSTLAFDISPTNVGSSTQFTVDTDDLPSSLAVGDWVALAGYSPLVQLPEECFPALVQCLHCRILQAIGDMEMLAVEKKERDEALLLMAESLAPRIESQAQVISSGVLLQGRPTRRFPRGTASE